LGADYSANAYPFSTRFQNCNQWLAELLAGAWGAGAEGGARAAAQAWLRRNGYAPTIIDPGALHLMALTPFLPWIHNADHPTAEIERRVYSVSMPASIEAFVHARLPAARRVELCHDTQRIVVHRGWDDLAPGCVPGSGDEVIALD
ncbi:MAG: DUF2145 domain-containing protein, partial [Burkholderiales bacterium]|nr:DUF2145 domain-containing protein [Burkholderiales bacterium]